METVQEILKHQTDLSESIKNDELREFLDLEGSTVSQGDLYIVPIDILPRSAKIRKNKQMATGNTPGSRHILTNGKAYDCESSEVQKIIKRIYKINVKRKYIGPVFETEGGVGLLEHPEHGDQKYVGDCRFAVIFQRSLDAEEKERIVLD